MKKTILIFVFVLVMYFGSTAAYAASYNSGKYNENIPYGSATYLAINTDGNVSLAVTPVSGGVQVTGTSHITVTSTDAVGYKLYLRSESVTSLDNFGDTIPTSTNVTPAPLSMNTWGYNTDGSNNFVGSSLSDTLIRYFVGPAPSGDTTSVTYGLKVDLSKPAGNYTTSVVYTAVPEIN